MISYTQIERVVRDVLRSVGRTFSVDRTSNLGVSSSITYYGIQVQQVIEEMPGSEILIGDWKLLIDSSTTPVEGDRITLNTGEYVVVKLEEIAPAGTVMAYWIWARRG